MDIKVEPLSLNRKHVLRHMLELYFHDFSECTTDDDNLELDDDGLYGYEFTDLYWTEPGRFPYIVTADGKLAGFSLIRAVNSDPLTFEVAEFFVVRKYRRAGVGRAMIQRMFELHRGAWVIDTPIRNIMAQPFWRGAVQRQTGDYTEQLVCDGQRLQWKFSNADC